MSEIVADDAHVADAIIRNQVERFTGSDPRCRALELPEGLLLRYNLARSLFFYLRTGVRDGKITTSTFASDSPYERQKALVGEVSTPMFEPLADEKHLDRVEKMLYGWVKFVQDEVDTSRDFTTFEQDR